MKPYSIPYLFFGINEQISLCLWLHTEIYCLQVPFWLVYIAEYRKMIQIRLYHCWKIGVSNCTKWCLLWTTMANTVLHFFFIFCTEWFYVPLLHCCWLYGGFIILFPVTVGLTIKPTKNVGLTLREPFSMSDTIKRENQIYKPFNVQ